MIKQAAAQSMRDHFPDPRRTPTVTTGGGRGTQSATEFHPSSSIGMGGLTQQQSAPKILQSIDDEHRASAPDNGAPIPNDYYKGAMTVEQRMLRKKENQIQKLTKDIEALTFQLDEASRERSMQRTELSRLRGLLAKSLSATQAPSASLATGPPQSASNRLRGRLLLSVGMDNAVRSVPLPSSPSPLVTFSTSPCLSVSVSPPLISLF
jgi:hypothetical protein